MGEGGAYEIFPKKLAHLSGGDRRIYGIVSAWLPGVWRSARLPRRPGDAADGGAVSCTGARECEINLAITQRLDDLLHLLGCPTLQLRQGDTDLASADAASISEKKVTDLKNRVARINQQADAVLVSIHQNQFSQSQYRGAQVFYAQNTESRAFAALMQQNLRAGLDPANKRECKPGSGIFLLEKIECPGILVECGFLSNPGEEALLRSKDYQKRLAAVLAGSITAFLAGRTAV